MAAERLAAQNDGLTTGIDTIDRRLGGGIQPGSLVSLVTPPSLQSHPILFELIRERPTVYIATLRGRSAIENDLAPLAGEDTEVSIQAVGGAAIGGSRNLTEFTDSQIYSINTTERERTFDDIVETVQTVQDSVNIIIDVANPLERSQSRQDYQTFLRSLKEKLIETDSLALLHCIQLESPPPYREETLSFADVVWELDIVAGRKKALEIQSKIPKNRGGEAILEKMTLNVNEDRVYIDDSRNI